MPSSQNVAFIMLLPLRRYLYTSNTVASVSKPGATLSRISVWMLIGVPPVGIWMVVYTLTIEEDKPPIMNRPKTEAQEMNLLIMPPSKTERAASVPIR